jgi:hypothetical protein
LIQVSGARARIDRDQCRAAPEANKDARHSQQLQFEAS